MDNIEIDRTSEHRGSVEHVFPTVIVNTPNPQENSNTQNESNIQSKGYSAAVSNRTSYSNVAKTVKFPKKDQAIVFPSKEEFQAKEYVIALGETIGPEHILYAGRMSNNRVCIYLTSKEKVESFITVHGGINIRDEFITARKLIAPAKRLILSNVQPCIPHYVIEDALKSNGLKLVSSMSFIGFGIPDDRYRHIGSHRRQIYVAEDDSAIFPSSLVITFEGEEYRIFISDDKIICFKCKSEGHVAAKCDKIIEKRPTEEQTSSKRPLSPSPVTTPENIGHPINIGENTPEYVMEIQPSENIEIIKTKQDSTKENQQVSREKPPKSNKRFKTGELINLESPSAEDDIQDISRKMDFQNAKHDDTDLFARPTTPSSSKRLISSQNIRMENQTDDVDFYKEIEALWPNEKYVLDFCTFIDFLKEVKGNDHPGVIARKYTEDLDGLIRIIRDAGREFKQRAYKSRCKRLTVTLKRAQERSEDDKSTEIQRYSSQSSLASSQEF